MSYDYGSAGHVGIGTPQANPTVEVEIGILMPANVMVSTVRLTSREVAPTDRLREYLRRLPDYLATFDTLKVDVFGFGCTASSYLISREEERRILGDAQDRFGYPIITAADAIAAQLDKKGHRRVALLSPYPPTLSGHALRYWQDRGFTVVESGCASQLNDQSDTRGIYQLGSQDGADALGRLTSDDVDAVLISGTGMPSLPVLAAHQGSVPVYSSNLCLAAAMMAHLGLADPVSVDSITGEAWRTRCAAAISLNSLSA